MIRLSRLSDYAIAIMCEMAMTPTHTLSATQVSQRTHIGESTVMKILKLLTKHHLLVSSRGTKGGYRIEKSSKDITLLDIICAIDGPVTLTLCKGEHSADCSYEPTCLARQGLGRVNQALADTLTQFNLHDVITPVSFQQGHAHVS